MPPVQRGCVQLGGLGLGMLGLGHHVVVVHHQLGCLVIGLAVGLLVESHEENEILDPGPGEHEAGGQRVVAAQEQRLQRVQEHLHTGYF